MILFLDLETTGLDLSEAHIVEFAALGYGFEPEPLRLLEMTGFSAGLVNPGIPIPPEASAVHHLVDADVAHAPTEDALAGMLAEEYAGRTIEAICGHNVGAYDLPIARKRLRWPPDAPVLDTYRLARHAWPDLPSYKLGVLAYRFGLHPRDVPADLDRSGKAGQHSAGYDCLVCAALLRRIMLEVEWETEAPLWHWRARAADAIGRGATPLLALAALSSAPITVKTIRFGKHSGTAVKDLPRDYVAWLLKQPWMQTEQPDLYATLRRM
ncbi:MAG: 3'-5' exonuclease [Chloroflexota bacterium]